MDEQLIHAPLARWAQSHGNRTALDDGHTQLTFAQLHQAVAQQASDLQQRCAPATVWVDAQASTVSQLVSFLAIISSDRCAAVGDPDWPPHVHQQVRGAFSTQAATPQEATPLSPFYIGFTSGSTGLPKGFRRHHLSWVASLQVCLDTFGAPAAQRVFAPGRFSHSLFLFGMMLGLWSGAGVVVQDKFSPARALETLRQGHTPCLVAVPSQLLMMLALATRRALAPITQVTLILISGARWMRQRTDALQALFPNARIVEFYGASETSFMAWMDADANAPPQAVGKPFANVEIDIRRPAPPLGVGQIFVRSPMLFMDYVPASHDSTAALREGDWLSVRDMGYVDEAGFLCLVGRENRMIVTQGKNLFPEELESLLLTHPLLAHACVQGVADALRGQQVVAVVQLKQHDARLSAQALCDWCRTRVESFKIPKRFYLLRDNWPLTPSGKTDHPVISRWLSAAQETSTCLLQPIL